MSFLARVRLLFTLFLAAFVLVFLRLVYWQVLSSGRLTAAAENQHFYSLSIPARRGGIKTADGFSLVANKDAFLLYASLPEITSDRKLLAKELAPILAADIPLIATDEAQIEDSDREQFVKRNQQESEEGLGERLNVQNAVWVNLAHFLSRDTRKKIEDRRISGLGFIDEKARDYPEGSVSAHVLGFVGFDAVGNPRGYFGLEGYYDRELAGSRGEIRIEKDAFGRPIAIGTETRVDKVDGSNLVLTLDRSVQLFAQRHLEDGIKTWKASSGTAVVMDPNNGAILAMASFPHYDPSVFSYYPAKLYKNPAVADLYEPGSIIKPLVMAAALNENKIKAETRCDRCEGPRKVADAYIRTFNNQYHPNLNMTEVLINSDNTGMVFVGEKLGFESLYTYLQRFGFSQKSGVDLQEEEGGVLRRRGDYYPLDQATLSFGQGISVNAMQMVRAWAALANGGYLVTPHLVDRIETPKGMINLSWPKAERVISETTAKVVTQMLVRVAKESPVRFPIERLPELARFRLAVKSGTAQIALGGKYQERGTIASVVGYFPADNPKFLVMVKLNEPEVRPWGSDTAGPVFAAITRDLLYYYGVSP